MQAQRVASDVDAVDAVAGADAGADPLLLAPHHLRDDVRVRHVGAGHRHHVDEPLAHAVLRGREVHDAGGVKHRDPGLALHPRRDVHVGRTRAGHARNGQREPALVSHLARDHVQEVAHAGIGVDPGDGETVLLIEPAFLQLVSHHPEADQEVFPHAAPDLLQDLEAEAGAVLDASPVFIGTLVDERGPELVDEMPVGEELDTVEPPIPATDRGVPERSYHPPDIASVHLLRERSMGVLAHRRRRDRGQPVLYVPQGAVSHVGDLAHERATVPVYALGELAEHGDDRVVADVDLPERGGGVRRDVRRPPNMVRARPPLAFSSW